ncbi:MAG: hypothetical protein HDS31_03440 [Bacteroides sp.]|nr:hypothetical protein [Bacteroides sp.]
MASRKDKHNKVQDVALISQLPSFSIHAKPMSSFSKVLNFAVSKNYLLNSFSYSNGVITVVLENGSIFSSPLERLAVRFEKVSGDVFYKLQRDGQKIKFYKTTNISNKEWDAINSVLCLAGTTWGRDMFSKQAKYVGYANLALKAIKALS